MQCDEVRPSCSQCRRGGRKCPGYERLMKFVDEGAKLRTRIGRHACQSPTPKLASASIEGDDIVDYRPISATHDSVKLVTGVFDNEGSRDRPPGSKVRCHGNLN